MSMFLPGALHALRTGRPVVLARTDGAADLVACSPFVTVATMSFLIRHGSGVVQVALGEDGCDRLGLAPTAWGRTSRVPGQRVAVDAASGITTGISAADRTRTAHLLADPDCGYDDLVRPGHVLPVGVPGATAVDDDGCALALCAMAGTAVVAVTCGLVSVSDPCRMAGPDELASFAAAHGVELLSADALLGRPLAGAAQVAEEALTA
jgi:3,4-dihydroxy-2-butanone 4-phosphate synthase